MSDQYTRLLARWENGEITREQYRHGIDELNKLAERREFFLEVGRIHERERRKANLLRGTKEKDR